MKVVRSADEAAAGVRVGAARGRSRTSPTRRSTSSATSRIRATSRCRCSPTRTATSSTSASATARSSAATRSSSRRRRRRPSTPELRERIGQIAVDAARAAGYRSAGTIEGLLDAGRRLLLHGDEHAHPGRAHGHRARHGPRPRPRAGARIAAGEPLSLRQEDVALRGHAIECRINAEDPSNGLPADARAGSRATASRPGRACASTRASSAGAEIIGLYDPMIAKLIVHDVDREARAAADAARARRSSRSAASRRCSGSTTRCSRTRASSPARRATALVESELLARAGGALSRSRRR